MKKVILIHGYTSSPKKKKYQIISKEFDELGIDYSIPVLPGGEHPHSKEWLEIIDKEVKNTTSPVVLVGHSLGTRAALLYLDRFEQKVDTVILIAAFNNNFRENRKNGKVVIADFFDYSLDIEKIKKLIYIKGDSHLKGVVKKGLRKGFLGSKIPFGIILIKTRLTKIYCSNSSSKGG